MENKDKEKQVKEAYIKKHGVWYEDALFRTKLAGKMLGENKQFSRILMVLDFSQM